MNAKQEELKAKIDCVLSEEKYIQRTVDQVARRINESPASVLRFCRTHSGYNFSTFRNEVFVALQDRVAALMEEEEKKLREAMEGGEETEGEKDTARLQPLRRTQRAKTQWQSILHNLSHVIVTLNRTGRMIPPCDKKILVEQAARDLEEAYAGFSKKTFNSIE